MPSKQPDDYVVDFPTLGPLIEHWIERHCVIPDGFHKGEPYVMADWQAWCAYNHYRVKERARWVPEQPVLGPAFHYRRSQIVAPQKALALNTPLATPAGWTTMGDVQVGDEVFDETGSPTAVVGKSQVWSGPCYRVRFSDGAELVASGDHEWAVERRIPSGNTYKPCRVTTSEMLGDLVDKYGARRYRVAMPEPLDLPDAELPLDPYVLGAWLGDGESAGGRITGLDEEVFAQIETAGFEVRPTKIAKRRQIIGLLPSLRAAGVLNDKHIPRVYLRASEKQRWALLQGLMDTDGYARVDGMCEFTTVSPRLRTETRELLWSLGIKNLCSEGLAKLNGRITGPKFRVSFSARQDQPVFNLTRKQSRLKPTGGGRARSRRRQIVSISECDSEPTQCLTVTSTSHIFLAGTEMIPTGNCGKGPWAASLIANEAAGPALFAGWAKAGDAYDCAEHGCSCGWGWDYDVGEPMGMPWPTPLIQLTAFSDEQTANTFRPLQSMIRNGLLGELLRITEGFIRLPNEGRVETVTASAQSRLGNPITFALQDETQLYNSRNRLDYVADTQNRGAAGMGGRGVETTNCWDPAENSTAQKTYELGVTDVFRFYRKPPPHLSYRNKEERRRIHRYNYDGSWWVDLDSIEGMALELMETDPAQAERFYGNRVVQGAGAWLEDGLWDSAELSVAKLLV